MVTNYGGFNYQQPFNPVLNAQQRLSQLEAQYPQFSQQPFQQFNNQQQGYKVIPVTNMEEANATQVDVQGTPTFFYNQAKNEVYLKRVNLNTGLADFIKFSRVAEPTTNEKESLNINTYEDNFKALNDKIDGLYSLLVTDQVKVKSDQVNLVTDQASDQVKNKGGKNAK